MTTTIPGRAARPAVPLYRQVTALICQAVRDRRLAQGAILPTRPALAAALGVSVATVDASLAELSALGLGTTAAGRPATIDLRPGTSLRIRTEAVGIFAAYDTADLTGDLPYRSPATPRD